MTTNKTAIANHFLLFQALNELMLSNYDKCKSIEPYFSQSLHTKLRNLKPEFEREAKKIHKIITVEEEYIRYNRLVTIIELIMESVGDLDKFNDIFHLLDFYFKGELRIESKEEIENPGQ